jgi:hypothetical protein
MSVAAAPFHDDDATTSPEVRACSSVVSSFQ